MRHVWLLCPHLFGAGLPCVNQARLCALLGCCLASRGTWLLSCLCVSAWHLQGMCATAPFSRHPARFDLKSVLVPRSGGRARPRDAEGACSTSGGATCSDCWACRAPPLLGPKFLQQCCPQQG